MKKDAQTHTRQQQERGIYMYEDNSSHGKRWYRLYNDPRADLRRGNDTEMVYVGRPHGYNQHS